MLIEVKVPMLAESIAEATLMKWHKKEGEAVKRGDSLIDIETDKVTLEVAAPNNGVLAEIIKQDGENVGSNEVIARINTESRAENKAMPAETPAAKETHVPEQVSLDISVASKDDSDSLPVLETGQLVDDDLPRLSPAVRNMIEQFDLNPADIKDSNNDGRLTKTDVIQHLQGDSNTEVTSTSDDEEPLQAVDETPSTADNESVKETPPPASSNETGHVEPLSTEQSLSTPASEPAGTSNQHDRVRRIPMTRLRQRVAERLLSAQHEHAILTTFNEVNLQPIMDLRDKYREQFLSAHGVKLGYMSFFTKASIEALKKFPLLNASTDGTDILYHDFFDIGIAVSTERGLVVPVLRDADALSLAELEAAIIQIGDKARQGKLSIDELTGGTFSITNGGIFGSMLSTPILNPPQSAILGMHKIQKRPVVEDDEIVIRPMMYLALSYDHRIIDGKEAVQFLVTVKELLEDPARLLLQV